MYFVKIFQLVQVHTFQLNDKQYTQVCASLCSHFKIYEIKNCTAFNLNAKQVYYKHLDIHFQTETFDKYSLGII